MKLFGKSAQQFGTRIGQLAIVFSLLLMVAGCGKDSDDGDVANTVELPVDIILDLYCEDVGLNTETCVLDDPDNPYRNTPFTTADPSDDDIPGADFNNAKFALANAAPSIKAKFYVYATALARAPNGENQWYTARALHELYTAGVAVSPPDGSALIKRQTLRAYRSCLDNFFDDATFFEAGFLPAPPPGGIAFPNKIRELTAVDLALTPVGFTPLFFPGDAGNNQFFARETMGGWGYTWVGLVEAPDGGGGTVTIPGPITRN